MAQDLPAATGFPWATLVVNVTGSFALGAVLVFVLERFPPSRYLRPFVATGFLGAYTTYSAFAVDTVMLVRDGRAVVGASYVVLTLLLALPAAWVGMAVARWVSVATGDRT